MNVNTLTGKEFKVL